MYIYIYIQSGGPNRERLYRAGYSPPRAGGGRADQARVEWKPCAEWRTE